MEEDINRDLLLTEVGNTLAVPYRLVWQGAVGGEFPARLVRGRWRVRASDLPLVAEALGVEVAGNAVPLRG
jgi:hypothetical protein